VLRATAGRRLELARRHGGGVYLYAPTARESIAGLPSVQWSPLAGCRDDGVAKLRVDALIDATETGDGIENSGHWKAGAKRNFRAYFLAAAQHPVWPGDFSLIPRWIAGQQYDEPLAVLRGLEGVTPAAGQRAAELLSVKRRRSVSEGPSFRWRPTPWARPRTRP